MKLKYLSAEKAILFLNDNGISGFAMHNLIDCILDGNLKPHFFFQGNLLHTYSPNCRNSEGLIISNQGIELSDQFLLVEFTGYVTPTNVNSVIKALTSNSNQRTYLKEIKITKYSTMELNYNENDDFVELVEYFSKINPQTTLEISYVSNPKYVEDHGISFTSHDCLFSVEELTLQLPTSTDVLTSFESVPTSEVLMTSNINHEFKIAVLAALESLNEDPKAITTFKNGKSGVKSEVKKLLESNPKISQLLKSKNAFNNKWQQLRDDGIIKSAD